VLFGIDLQVDEGEIVCLIGPNGAGKTTLLRVVCCLLQPYRGSVELAGEPLSGRPVHELVRRGVAMVPEGKQLWPQMTVRETLAVAGASRGLSKDEFASQREFVERLFPILARRRDDLAHAFSGGEQQMLAIARALMARPRLLLLDEPSLGLAPMVVSQVFDAVAQIRAQGVSVLLVEQSMRQALALSDRAYLLDRGQVRREGRASELAALGQADLAALA
jgi:branched-chain amino acid transport system ATP-binding protein